MNTNGLLEEKDIINYEQSIVSLRLSNLNNGLSDLDNIELMSSSNINEIVALILKGLFNTVKENNNVDVF